MSEADNKLALALRHLEHVQAAWDEPTDWDDLSLYGFYALEAAVDAACIQLGISTARAHAARVDACLKLSSCHGLRDVSDLLRDLNDARKSVAYGDIEMPDLAPEEVAHDIKVFIEDVRLLIQEGGS